MWRAAMQKRWPFGLQAGVGAQDSPVTQRNNRLAGAILMVSGCIALALWLLQAQRGLLGEFDRVGQLLMGASLSVAGALILVWPRSTSVVLLLALTTLYAYIQGAVFFDLGLHRGRPDADALTRLLPFLPLLYIASFVLLIRRAVWVSIVNGVLLIAMGCAALLMWGADTGPAAAPSQTVRSLIAAQPIYLLVLMWMAMQRRQAEAAQQSAIRSKLTLLGMISHELRSPLQTIVASIELLAVRFKTSQASDVEYAALLRIRSAATQLGSHVRDLIEFTKMEAGSSQPHTGRFRLDDVLDDLVDEYAEEALDRGNHLSLEVADDCHDVVGDELRLRQIVNNLVSNAVKYTSGGSIVVSAKRAGPISDTIELRVADSGIGISQGKIEEIWKPYTRLEGDARVKSVKGTGLGLSVVRLLVSMLSGEIQIKSEQGAGTTITVLLPLPIASGGGR